MKLYADASYSNNAKEKVTVVSCGVMSNCYKRNDNNKNVVHSVYRHVSNIESKRSVKTDASFIITTLYHEVVVLFTNETN